MVVLFFGGFFRCFCVDGVWTSAATVLAGTPVWEYILGVALAALGFYGSYKM